MMIVITGGSASGKSAYAEETILSLGEGERIYIATMFPFDEESHKRIARHRKMRMEKQFTTIERYTDIGGIALPPNAQVLLECMSNLVANEMFQENGAGVQTVEAILAGIAQLQQQAQNLCIVTNEIFSDGIVYDTETVRYQRYLGEINQALAKKADLVIEVVYGIPIIKKGGKGLEAVVE